MDKLAFVHVVQHVQELVHEALGLHLGELVGHVEQSREVVTDVLQGEEEGALVGFAEEVVLGESVLLLGVVVGRGLAVGVGQLFERGGVGVVVGRQRRGVAVRLLLRRRGLGLALLATGRPSRLLPIELLGALAAEHLPHGHHVAMLQLLQDLDLPQHGGRDAPVRRGLQSDLLQRYVLVGPAAGLVDATGAVDLAVGAFADLFQADVVGDAARGQRPAVRHVVGAGQRVLRGGLAMAHADS